MSVPFGPILLSIFAVVVLVIGARYPLWSDAGLGSGLMPAAGAGLVLIASIAEVFAGTREQGEAQDRHRIASYIAALILLPPAVVVLGMLPALTLLAVAVLVAIERLSWARALMIAGASLAFNWLVFQHLLQVSLPRSVLW
jgi:hypothetical protein